VRLLLLSGLAALGILGGREEYTVQILDRTFQPDHIVIKVGTRVTWRNGDSMDHTVTAKVTPAVTGAQDRPRFDSGPIAPGSTFSYTFLQDGTFEYSCKLHPGMNGSVVVLPAP